MNMTWTSTKRHTCSEGERFFGLDKTSSCHLVRMRQMTYAQLVDGVLPHGDGRSGLVSASLPLFFLFSPFRCESVRHAKSRERRLGGTTRLLGDGRWAIGDWRLAKAHPAAQFLPPTAWRERVHYFVSSCLIGCRAASKVHVFDVVSKNPEIWSLAYGQKALSIPKSPTYRVTLRPSL